MNANKLLDKIIAKGLSVTCTLELCEMICGPENLTIGEAMMLKELLNLTNLEAVEIFLS